MVQVQLTPKVKTKMAFDRVSTSNYIGRSSTLMLLVIGMHQTYAVGTNIKYNGGYWQATLWHTLLPVIL